MNLAEATQILNYVDKKTWNEINQLYSIDDISDALEICYNSRRKKIVLKTIDKVISEYTLHGSVLLIKAMLLIDETRFQDAIHLLTLVPSDDKEFLFCIELIGLIFVNNFQFQKGIQTFSVLLTQEIPDERKAYIHYQRAVCFQYEQKFVSALHDCITAAELYEDEDDFYKDALLNLQLCIENEMVLEVKDLVLFFEKFCSNVLKNKIFYGPILFLLEVSLLKNNFEILPEINKILENYEFDQKKGIQKRLKQVTKFLKLSTKYISIDDKIKSFSKPSFNHYLNHKIRGREFYRAEDRVYCYINKIKPFKDQMEDIKIKLLKLNEIDFRYFEKMQEVNFLNDTPELKIN